MKEKDGIWTLSCLSLSNYLQSFCRKESVKEKDGIWTICYSGAVKIDEQHYCIPHCSPCQNSFFFLSCLSLSNYLQSFCRKESVKEKERTDH